MIQFKDDVYEPKEILSIRETVRVIARYLDQYVFLQISGDDEFGHRDHLETIGGGIEEGESREAAIKREVMEETGRSCIIRSYLCDVIDDYHLLQRRTLSHFYVVDLLEKTSEVTYSELEKQLIKGIVFLTPQVVLNTYEHALVNNVEQLIYRRDAYAFKQYLKGQIYEQERV